MEQILVQIDNYIYDNEVTTLRATSIKSMYEDLDPGISYNKFDTLCRGNYATVRRVLRPGRYGEGIRFVNNSYLYTLDYKRNKIDYDVRMRYVSDWLVVPVTELTYDEVYALC